VPAVLVLPKTLDADMLAGRRGLGLAEYAVLVHLSEAGGSMRMNELAAESILTASGVTRLVERMERQGLVVREQAHGDGRGMTATATEAGFERLSEAYPYHLASVRTHVIDHLNGLDLIAFAKAVGSFVSGGRELQPRRLVRRPPTSQSA
jgi:DNA-binding MarR family transcriptional regulator